MEMIYDILKEFGVATAFLAVMIWLHVTHQKTARTDMKEQRNLHLKERNEWKKDHAEERAEWKQELGELHSKTSAAISDLSEVIKRVAHRP